MQLKHGLKLRLVLVQDKNKTKTKTKQLIRFIYKVDMDDHIQIQNVHFDTTTILDMEIKMEFQT